MQNLQGRLHTISAETFQSSPDSPPYYVVEIALILPKIPPNGGVPLLRPGMPAQVFIRKQNYRLSDYLLEPIRNYFAQALREY